MAVRGRRPPSKGGEDTLVRTFVAVPVDAPVREAVARWQERLAAPGDGIKWVEPHNLHLTVAFLGDLEPEDVTRVQAAVARGSAGHPPITLHFGGFGVFPGWHAPRVLWIGAEEGAAELTALANSVAAALLDAGFRLDERPYRPHLTVGRWRTPAGAERVRAAVAGKPSGLPSCRIDRVDIMASRLTPRGPVYSRMGHVALQAPGEP